MTVKKNVLSEHRWAAGKRIKVTAGAGGVILVSAMVLGTLIYRLGTWSGIFRPFNLRAEVEKRVLSDQALIIAFEQAMSKHYCENNDLGYTYEYDPSLTVTEAFGRDKCSELTYPLSATESSYLKVQKHESTAGETVDRWTVRINEVVTDTLPHEKYAGTMISGNIQGIPIRVAVIKENDNQSWSLVMYPVNLQNEPMMTEVVKSFTLNDGRLWL